eukprot:1487383-Rhodomonas_salina.1
MDAMTAPFIDFTFVDPSAASSSLLFSDPGVSREVVDTATIDEIVPASGSARGGYIVGLYVRGFNDSLPINDYRVLFGDIICLPSKIVAVDDEVKLVEVVAPSKSVGSVSVSVYNTQSAFPQTDRVASTIFHYNFDTTFTVVGKPEPSSVVSSGGIHVALTLNNVPFSASVDSFLVTLDSVSCEVVGLLSLSAFDFVLYFVTPPLQMRGAVSGMVTVQGFGEQTYSATFELSMKSDSMPEIVSAYPSAASSLGGTRMVVAISRFTPISQLNEVVVLIDQVRAQVDRIITSSPEITEIGFTAPPFPCSSSRCPVKVEIQSVSDINEVVSFDFEYAVAVPRIRTVHPSTAPDAGGSTITVDIENFPQVSTLMEVIIRFDELRLEVPPQSILISDSSRTVLTFRTPPVSPASSVHVRVVNLFDQANSVDFDMELLSTREPVLVSFTPTRGPSNSMFDVHAIIDNYPVAVTGLDSNFALVSGPKAATVTVGSVVAGAPALSIISGGGAVNSTVQLSFRMPSLPGDTSTVDVEVGIDNLRYFLGFTVELYDPSNPIVLATEPAVGPVSGAAVSVELGSFPPATRESVIVLAQGVPCFVSAVLISGFTTIVRFNIAAVSRPSLSTVQIYSTSDASKKAEFTFRYEDSCDYDVFCASRGGMEKDSVKLVGAGTAVECDVNFCIDPALVMRPKLLGVENAAGPANGGTLVTLLVQDFPADTRPDVMISCMGAFVQNLSLEQIPGSVARIVLESPTFLAEAVEGALTVSCLVLSRKSSTSQFSFDFTYYPVRTDLQVETGVPECYSGDNLTISAVVKNAAPLSHGHQVMVQNSADPADRAAANIEAEIAISDWRYTKLFFPVTCDSAYSIRLWWPGVDGFLDVPMTVKPAALRVLSFFPRSAPTGRLLDVQVKLAGGAESWSATSVTTTASGVVVTD